MKYKGFIIDAKPVITNTGQRDAYQVVCPQAGLIVAICPTLSRAQKIIDRNGQRWQLVTSRS